MKYKSIGIALLALLILPYFASAGADAKTRTEIHFFDAWPADAILDAGRMWCPGEELGWINPLTPNCGDGEQFHLQGIEMYSCLTALDPGGYLEPRATGTMWFTINANFDRTMSGPVNGKWVLVPGDCSPSALDETEVFWEGNWQGFRSQICDDGCRWVGNIHVVGHGHGGNLEGLKMRGFEEILTFTPLPAPWELIPGFPYTGPEGSGVFILVE